MGRQLEVSLSEDQEREFLAFLRSTTNLQIIRSFAPTQEELFVTSFEPRAVGNFAYYLWNREFEWAPLFAMTRTDPPSSYVSNKADAPLIEYSRYTMHGLGRIYWAKHFSAPDGLAYDVGAFEAWYNSVVRWLKRLKSSGAA
jgi:hypothetical protein